MDHPGFLDELRLRLLSDAGARPQFELLSVFRFYSAVREEVIAVPAGARSDGASVPQVAMAVTGYPGLRAAVVHDYLVTHPELMAREAADLVFREALACCGVDVVTRALMYNAVAGYTSGLHRAAAGASDPCAGGA